MRSIAAFTVFVLCMWLTAGAQEPKGQPKAPPKDEKKDKNQPKEKAEPVAGRKTKKIEGFTFLISEEALNQDVSSYKRPPLEVLEYECKLLTKMMSPKAINLLRKLTIFVNWDDQIKLSNGRTGRALASYYSGSPQQMAQENRHPLQSKTVTIHTLKLLTEERQPQYDTRTSCLLLHEFAHAVHDQLCGFDNPTIKAAYEQAMERRLYEKDSYAATNHREFFAEVSCAYIDRLWYYPHNRADLKKHDPVTYKAMETIWSGATMSKVAVAPLPHSEKANMEVKFPDDVKLGKQITGSKFENDKLAGKVVLIGYWGGPFTNVLNRLERLQNDLGEYGLVVIAPCTYKEAEEAITKKGEERSPHISVLQNAFVREEKGPTMKSQPGGHALVFDPAGKCVYRGSAYDMDDAVRAAVGKALLIDALGSEEIPKAFKPVADAFAAGSNPIGVITKLTPLTTSSDANIKEAAKKLSDRILGSGQQALADAQANAKTNPVNAFFTAEQVAAKYKNTPLASKATALVTSIRTDKAVAVELKARTLAIQVEAICGKLRGQEGSINPEESDFQARNRAAIDQIKALLEQIRKQFPNTRALVEAEKAAREFVMP